MRWNDVHPARRECAGAHGISKERISLEIRISVCMPRQSRKSRYIIIPRTRCPCQGEKNAPRRRRGGAKQICQRFWVVFSEHQTGRDPGRNAKAQPDGDSLHTVPHIYKGCAPKNRHGDPEDPSGQEIPVIHLRIPDFRIHHQSTAFS